jgi:hypothetical protein
MHDENNQIDTTANIGLDSVLSSRLLKTVLDGVGYRSFAV